MWDELPADVRAELEDPEFITRKHYSRSTYALGCHGPLCRKAERDRGRGRNERKAADKYKPALKRRLAESVDMDAIIEWHIKELAERRTKAS